MELSTLINKKALHWLLACGVLALIIWFLGPYFSIGEKQPLLTIGDRLITIIVLFLSWLLVNLLIQIRRYHLFSGNHLLKQSGAAAISTIFTKLFQILQAHKSQVMTLTELTYDKQWVLLLGPAGAGKTSLLKNAELVQSVAYSTSLQNTDIFNVFIFDSAIFFEIPGKQLAIEQTENQPSAFFSQFYAELKKWRRKAPCDSVVITLNLQELLVENDERLTKQIQQLRLQLGLLIKTIGKPFPVYLAINQFDLLAGFIEFFGDLSVEERHQFFGIDLKQRSLNLTDAFNQEYVSLLKRLHDRLLWRLHQESRLDKRLLIQEFPTQLEAIQSLLSNCLHQLFNDFSIAKQIDVQGLYFTSALQQGTPIDRFSKSISSVYALEPIKLKTHHLPPKSYFAHQLFLQSSDKQLMSPLQHKKQFVNQQILSYGIGVTVCLAGVLLCWRSFTHTNAELTLAQQAFWQYHGMIEKSKANPQTIAELMASLHALNKISSHLPSAANSPLVFANHEINQLHTQTTQAYKNIIKQQLLPTIRQIAYQQLYSADLKNLPQIYRLLRIYLMLGDAKHVDVAIIKPWLHETLQQQVDGSNVKLSNLENEITTILLADFGKVTLDPTLIASARQVLQHLPPNQLALAILYANNDKKNIALFDNAEQDIFLPPYNTIPGIYSVAAFKQINDQTIRDAVNIAMNGDWVLGVAAKPDNSEADIVGLSQLVKQTYYQLYITIWRETLEKTQLIKFDNVDQANKVLLALSGNNSQLLQLLKTIDDNTAPIRDGDIPQIAPDKSQIPAPFYSQLSLLHTFISNPSQKQLLLRNLDNLKMIFQQCSEQGNGAKLIFALARDHMQQNSNDVLTPIFKQLHDLPPPVQVWMDSVADNAWDLLLQQTHHYLNQVWQNQVVTEYNNYIGGRYPLSKAASIQVDLDAFSHFFGPTGTLESFYQVYLDPFINSHATQWKLISVDGHDLGIEHKTIMQLELARFIRKIYFPDNIATPQAKFMLQPIALGAAVAEFNIKAGQSNLHYDREATPQQTVISWPSDNPTAGLELTVKTYNNELNSQNESGPWAWFKLLDSMHVETTKDPKRFVVTFSLEHNGAKYLLLASDDLNPFIPHVIDEFNCPPEL